MQVYLSLVQDEKDVSAEVRDAIAEWLGEGKEGVTPIATEAGEPGVEVTMSTKFDLKDPLNALQSIASKQKCNFVVGFIDEQSGTREDVCYFGHEEGRPDLHEIACYLGT